MGPYNVYTLAVYEYDETTKNMTRENPKILTEPKSSPEIKLGFWGSDQNWRVVNPKMSIHNQNADFSLSSRDSLLMESPSRMLRLRYCIQLRIEDKTTSDSSLIRYRRKIHGSRVLGR
jgi:hypothetical protein